MKDKKVINGKKAMKKNILVANKFKHVFQGYKLL